MFLFLSLPLPTTKSAGSPHSVPSPSSASYEAQAWFDWFVGSEMRSLEEEQQKVERYSSFGAIRVLKRCLGLTSGWEKNGRQRKENRKNYYYASLCVFCKVTGIILKLCLFPWLWHSFETEPRYHSSKATSFIADRNPSRELIAPLWLAPDQTTSATRSFGVLSLIQSWCPVRAGSEFRQPSPIPVQGDPSPSTAPSRSQQPLQACRFSIIQPGDSTQASLSSFWGFSSIMK